MAALQPFYEACDQQMHYCETVTDLLDRAARSSFNEGIQDFFIQGARCTVTDEFYGHQRRQLWRHLIEKGTIVKLHTVVGNALRQFSQGTQRLRGPLDEAKDISAAVLTITVQINATDFCRLNVTFVANERSRRCIRALDFSYLLPADGAPASPTLLDGGALAALAAYRALLDCKKRCCAIAEQLMTGGPQQLSAHLSAAVVLQREELVQHDFAVGENTVSTTRDYDRSWRLHKGQAAVLAAIADELCGALLPATPPDGAVRAVWSHNAAAVDLLRHGLTVAVAHYATSTLPAPDFCLRSTQLTLTFDRELRVSALYSRQVSCCPQPEHCQRCYSPRQLASYGLSKLTT